MAATTLSRPTLTDGVSDVTGDVVNAAFFGTNVYDVVDAVFVADVQWEKTTNAVFTLGSRNASAGAAAVSRVAIGNNTSALQTTLDQFSTGYTTSGTAIQDSLRVLAAGTNGMSLATSSGTSKIRFYPGNIHAAEFVATGHLCLQELTTNPGTADLTADAALAVYTKADKLVFAYNNGGTMTYITLDLDGSDTTLTHGTSAP